MRYEKCKRKDINGMNGEKKNGEIETKKKTRLSRSEVEMT